MLPDDHYIEVFSDDDVRLRGTRVGIEHILWAYLDGMLGEEIAMEFPTIPLEQIHGLIAYYLRHKKQVDEYMCRQKTQTRREQNNQRRKTQPEVVKRLRNLVSMSCHCFKPRSGESI